VQGLDGFNVVLAWWTEPHANKRDDAISNEFEPTRREYTNAFMADAVDELKLRKGAARGGGAESLAIAP
jgi:hypothetical protein